MRIHGISAALLVLLTSSLSLCTPSFLLRNATIATWNDTSQAVEVYRQASILVRGDEVVQIYKQRDAIQIKDVESYDATNKIIVPGYISTHQHVWQTLYKTLIPNLPFAASWVLWSYCRRAQQLGWKATFDSGGRSFFAATVQPKKTFTEDAQIAQIKTLAFRPESRNSSLVTLGLSYDLFESASSASQSKILGLAHSGNINFISTHYVGGPFGTYNSPELLNRADWSLMNGSMPVMFSHASHVTPLDASILRQTNQYISIAPESELHAGHGHPYSHLIQDQASLASDSVFAFSVSLVNQARMWLQQVRCSIMQLAVDQWRISTNTPMTVNQAFYLLTRAGGLALRRPDLGIIAKGAKADFVMYDTTQQALIGWRDPVAAVILHSNPSDISDVMVGGKFVKRNFKLTFKNLPQLIRDFQQSSDTFAERYYSYDFGELPRWYSLATYRDVDQVDVVRGNVSGY